MTPPTSDYHERYISRLRTDPRVVSIYALTPVVHEQKRVARVLRRRGQWESVQRLFRWRRRRSARSVS